MPVSIKSSLILVKPEATSGTDSNPTPGANAVGMQVEDFACKIEQRSATNEIVGTGFGSTDMIPYARRGKISFKVPLAGSGAAGTAPAWDALLQACAVNGTPGTAPVRIDYLPISAALKTATIWGYVNGQLEKFNYAAGTFKLNWTVGQVPTIAFEFTALVTSVAAGAAPNATMAAWKRPLAFGPATCNGVNFGSTYAAGAITGGTTYPLKNLELDSGNEVIDLEMAGTESVGVYDWSPKITMVTDMAPADLAGLYGAMNSGAQQSFALTHGSAAGAKMMLHAPLCQITDIEDQREGKLFLAKITATCVPSSAGNDAWRLVHL